MEKNKNFLNIIIRMPNWLGDFVMALPILEEVRANFPKAKIMVMCLKSLADLLKDDERVNELFILEKKNIPFFSKEQRQIIKELKEKKFDLGILLTNSFSSAYLFFKAKIETTIGYKAHFRRLFLTDAISFPQNREKKHQVEIYQELLSKSNLKVEKFLPQIYLKEEELLEAKKILEQEGCTCFKKIIGMNPSAAYGPAKCWPKEKFVETAKLLLEEKDTFVVFFGDERSKKEIAEIVKNFLSSRAINLAGKTNLRQLAALLKICRVFLTNDSGPMHLAAAVGKNPIALFGSTSDIMTGPYKTGVVINKKVACAPCFKRECDKDFSCMEKIKVEEVLSQIKKMF